VWARFIPTHSSFMLDRLYYSLVPLLYCIGDQERYRCTSSNKTPSSNRSLNSSGEVHSGFPGFTLLAVRSFHCRCNCPPYFNPRKSATIRGTFNPTVTERLSNNENAVVFIDCNSSPLSVSALECVKEPGRLLSVVSCPPGEDGNVELCGSSKPIRTLG
jgi:hypothetical protein